MLHRCARIAMDSVLGRISSALTPARTLCPSPKRLSCDKGFSPTPHGVSRSNRDSTTNLPLKPTCPRPGRWRCPAWSVWAPASAVRPPGRSVGRGRRVPTASGVSSPPRCISSGTSAFSWPKLSHSAIHTSCAISSQGRAVAVGKSGSRPMPHRLAVPLDEGAAGIVRYNILFFR